VRLRLPLLVLLACVLCAAQAQPGCSPSPEIEQILRPDKPDPSANPIEQIEKAMAAYPGDFHLIAEYLIRTALDTARPGRVKLAGQLRAQSRGAAEETLAALSWLGEETPKAIDGLKAAQSKHPEFPWPAYFLASSYSFPKFRDNKQSAELAATFLKACPDSLPAYNYVSRATLPEIQRPLAAALRARLEKPSLTARELNAYSTLWTLEFRAAPADQYALLREQVKKDLERIKSFDGDRTRTASLERTAAQLIGDAEAAKEAERRAMSTAAGMEGMDEYQKWSKENPYPAGEASQQERDAYIARRRQAVRDFAAKYPKNRAFRDMRLTDEMNDKSKTNEELEALAAEFLKEIDGTPTRSAYRYRRVARLWVERDIHLDEVPRLLEESLKLAEASPIRGGKTDLLDTGGGGEIMTMNDRIDHWQLVALYESKRGNKEGAARARSEIAALLERHKPKPGEKDQNAVMMYWMHAANYYRQQGGDAEREKRTLDALAWYRKLIEADRQRPTPVFSREDSPFMKKTRELWAALGGSPETYDAWLEASPSPATPAKSRPAVASSGMPPKQVSMAMPPMDLKDMEGRSWTLANLRGKATLINFWATWCGPCREELIYLQKLYNQTQERKDVQVITLNMDDNPGLIEPFLRQHKYTFPVLLAKDYADASFQILGIPTNYLADSTATVKLEYVGFGGNGDDWIKKMLSGLESLNPH
jgi:thiol-disulfide isomerase/thioredoxin